MTKLTRLVSILVVCVAAGCGGSSGSGLDSSLELLDLSAGEVEQLCEYVVDVQDGPRTVECGDGVTVELSGVEECVEDFDFLSDDCAATVLDAERCAEDLGADPCALFAPSCAPLFECSEF